MTRIDLEHSNVEQELEQTGTLKPTNTAAEEATCDLRLAV